MVYSQQRCYDNKFMIGSWGDNVVTNNYHNLPVVKFNNKYVLRMIGLDVKDYILGVLPISRGYDEVDLSFYCKLLITLNIMGSFDVSVELADKCGQSLFISTLDVCSDSEQCYEVAFNKVKNVSMIKIIGYSNDMIDICDLHIY